MCLASIVVQAFLVVFATRRYLREQSPHDVQWFGVSLVWLLLILPVLAVSGIVDFAIREFGGNLAAYLSQTEVSVDLQHPLLFALAGLSFITCLGLALIGLAVLVFWRNDLWYWQSAGAFLTGWLAQVLVLILHIPLD